MSHFAILLSLLVSVPGTLQVQAAELDTARGELRTLLAHRDKVLSQLQQRISADAALAPAQDLHLECRYVAAWKPLTAVIQHRGGRFVRGRATLKGFNGATHIVDASKLNLSEAGLQGSLTVTLMPDNWVPADGKPRQQVYQITASRQGDSLTGRYRMEGERGPERDRCSGKLVPVSDKLQIDGPNAADIATADAARLARMAFDIYKQYRAALLAMQEYPQTFASCLALHTVPEPEWPSNNSDAQLATWIGQLASIARMQETAKLPPAKLSEAPLGDQRFGPYFKSTALPLTKDGMPSLPAETGQPGPQRWQFIENWSVTGPFPGIGRLSPLVAGVPEFVPAPGLSFAMSPKIKQKIKSEFATSGRINSVTAQVQGDRWSYSMLPPVWSTAKTKIPSFGLPGSIYFATAQLYSDKDTTVWAELNAGQSMQLWVNQALAWNTPVGKPASFHLAEISLKKGVNHLLVRVRHDYSRSSMRLRFCTRGVPQAKKEAVASKSQQDADRPRINFRGPNGDGHFPAVANATPPTAWNIKDGTNVAWRTPLPGFSHSYPVIVGDKIFTNAEPHTLYCIDKNTGSILWQRDSSVAELIADESKRPDAEAYMKKLGGVGFTVSEAVKGIQDQIKVLALQRRDLGEDGDPRQLEKIDDELVQLKQQLKDASPGGQGGATALKEFGIGRAIWFEFTGWTMGTPVTDGTHIWVRYGTGMTACYSMDGERQWMQYTGLRATIGSVGSPILVAGLLIQESQLSRTFLQREGLKKADVEAQLTGVGSLRVVMAMDAQTGERKWHRYIRGGSGDYGGPFGPRGMRLRKGDEHLDVVLAGANIIRATDGALLHDATGHRVAYSGIVRGNRLYTESSAAAFWMESQDQVGVRRLLSYKKAGVTGVVVHGDNSIWSNPASSLKGARKRVDWNDAYAFDGTTGKEIWRHKTIAENTGEAYVCAASVGKDLIYLVDGGWGSARKPQTGQIQVISTKGGTYQPLSRSLIEVTYSAPIFEGSRMYMRSRQSLTCFETTSDAGRQYEYEQSVKELFDTRGRLPDPPRLSDVPDLQADKNFKAAAGVPISKAYPSFAPDSWLILGPLPASEWKGKDALAALGGPAAARPVPDQSFVLGEGGSQGQFKPLTPKAVKVSGGLFKDMYSRDTFSLKAPIDLLQISKRGNSVFYLYSVIEVSRTQVFKFDNANRSVASWMSGQKIEHGKLYRLHPGYYPIMLRMELGKLPPVIKNLAIKPKFSQRDDPREAMKAWKQKVSPYMPRLKTIVERLGSHPLAFKAKVLIKAYEDR